ncbi:hypothetical protein THMA_1017 [Thermotoga maritima MSB8]|nr:Putative uncharacterized protein [Thermotoga neapolitana DSM 4359]AGL49924.1 hypothetical protein Tmari_0999 [Thermotoga maritima MSB8]AKE26907.1 hypothetical protein THMC_1017 [Thermotoga maritima]AKE28772.1 hypothetical protein THMA_1017 [Thermotoga maritima MSB8]AKE30645.1 hypothetical protein THMB_1017 [Thermotoga maritima]
MSEIEENSSKKLSMSYDDKKAAFSGGFVVNRVLSQAC